MTYKKKLQYLWAAVIIVIAVAISAGMLLYAINRASNRNNGGKQSATQREDSNHSQSKEYTVNFHDAGGNKLKNLNVKQNGFAEPPRDFNIGDRVVFLGWDRDILHINDNVDISPIVNNITDSKNVIYANAIYIPNGRDFSLPIRLGGIVECSGFKITAVYDRSVLEYLGCGGNASAISVSNDKEKAVVEIIMNSEQNVTKSMVLTNLNLKPIGHQYTYTELKLKIDAVQKLSPAGSSIGTDCTLYNGKIYIY